MRYFFILTLMLSFLSSFAQVHLVTNLADTGPGSLREKIMNANDGDTVQISQSLLGSGNSAIGLNSEIVIDKSITIIGAIGATDSVFISGGIFSRAFDMDFNSGNKTVRLKDLILEDCKSTAFGGAIRAMGIQHLIVENCLFRRNRAQNYGGAIRMAGGKITCINSVFKDNGTSSSCGGSASHTGGAIEVSFGEFYLDNCQFIDNFTCARGGAIAFPGCFGTITDCKFDGNEALGGSVAGGGAAHFNGGTVTVKRTIFSNNTCDKGGGAVKVTSAYTTVAFEDCSFIANHSQSGSGGAIETFGLDVLDISRCTFSGNTISQTVTVSGGAIFSNGSVNINESTIYNNDLPAVHVSAPSSQSLVVKNSTLVNSMSTAEAMLYAGTNQTAQLQSNVIAAPGSGGTFTGGGSVTSLGYNIYRNNPSFSITTDQTSVSYASLAFSSLGNYGGLTKTLLPGAGSPALEMGNPADFSNAQNAPIFGTREVGAAESRYILVDTISSCEPVSWWGSTYTSSGVYSDTVTSSSSIDSVGILYLDITTINTSVNDSAGFLVASDSNVTYQWVDCDNGFAIISGATNSSFLPVANGNYAVVISKASCVDTSLCFNYNQVSVIDHRLEQTAIYPNPTSGVLRIKLSAENRGRSLQAEVLNISGKLLFQKTINAKGGSDISLNVEHLPKGIYFLKINEEVMRFVKD